MTEQIREQLNPCLACYNAGRLVGEWVEGVEAGEVSTYTLHASQLGRVQLHGTHEELVGV